MTFTNTSKDAFFAFGDIETGGLNGRLDNGQMGMSFYPIFEIAFIVTDAELNPIGEPLHLVIHQDEEAISKSHPWALDFHTESGLIKEVRQSTLTLEQAEEKIISHFASLGIAKFDRNSRTGIIFAGNSIMFDRTYFMAQMPKLHEYMHYRQLDVSSLAVLCKAWKPEISEKVGAIKSNAHLALPDIIDCIAELKVYRDELFKGSIPLI